MAAALGAEAGHRERSQIVVRGRLEAWWGDGKNLWL